MNVLKNRVLFLLLFAFFLGNTPLDGNVFLDAAQVQLNKVAPKPVTHKSPLEFKQAVARYVKHTEAQCLQGSHRYVDEHVSYKKELRYLFHNYGKFSTATLLSRLRSAHEAMVKYELSHDSDVYKRYEQIASSLLLICTQVFFNDARDQILNALHEIDNLIAYWRYQHNHQVRYFFSKSPTKWIIGREQEKEITYNLHKLERKQRDLYILLGLLTEHVHAFTESSVTYTDCYAWMEELFVVLSCIKGSPNPNNVNQTQFDTIAAQLELKIKRVAFLKDDFLLSVASSRKPNHFVRNWIAYTTLVAATAYGMHCHTKNPELFPAAFKGIQGSAKYLFVLLVDPLKQIYKRMETAFSPKVVNDNKSQIIDAINDPVLDLSVDDICNQIIKVGNETVADINEELAKSNTSLRQDALTSLAEVLEDVKNPKDGIIWSTAYTFNEDTIGEAARAIIATKVEPITQDGVIINEAEVKKYQETLAQARQTVQDLAKATPVSWTGVPLWLKLQGVDKMLCLTNNFLDPLQQYTKIIDNKILKLVQLIAILSDNLARRGDILINQANIKLDEADATLQDNELTFMFTALIPLIGTCAGITKTYQWVTKKNYAPIRIALADINALLIESAMQLDDYDYGKLVYLICKLKHTSKLLKSTLSGEFLIDVAKLESKRYTAQTKRDIVENMFNKYSFLGRIAA